MEPRRWSPQGGWQVSRTPWHLRPGGQDGLRSTAGRPHPRKGRIARRGKVRRRPRWNRTDPRKRTIRTPTIPEAHKSRSRSHVRLKASARNRLRTLLRGAAARIRTWEPLQDETLNLAPFPCLATAANSGKPPSGRKRFPTGCRGSARTAPYRDGGIRKTHIRIDPPTATPARITKRMMAVSWLAFDARTRWGRGS